MPLCQSSCEYETLSNLLWICNFVKPPVNMQLCQTSCEYVTLSNFLWICNFVKPVNMRLCQTSCEYATFSIQFSNCWQIFQVYISLFVFFDFQHFYDEPILGRILLFLGTLGSIPRNLSCLTSPTNLQNLLIRSKKVCSFKITSHVQKVQPLQTEHSLNSRNLELLINQ